MAKAGDGGASVLEALFTATSAVCVTGLITVDTPVFWSGFGQVVILVLIQIGGFGVMSFGTLLGVLTARRLGLQSRISAAAETKSSGFGDVRRVLVGVLAISLIVEAVLALVLAIRFMAGYGYRLAKRFGTECSTPSPPSTTPALPCIRTTSWGSSAIPGSVCRSLPQ